MSDTEKPIVMSDEMRRKANELRIENEDKKEDAQRNMAWWALGGMLTFPLTLILTSYLGLSDAASILRDIASVYFVSVAAILAAFYGKEAYTKGK